MMHTSRHILRIAASKTTTMMPSVATRSSSRLIAGRVILPSVSSMQQEPQQQRNFASMEAIHPSESQVKEAIKRMMVDKEDIMEVLNPIEDGELDQSFQRFQNVLHEAELCVSDLKEAAGEEFDEELQCAEGAVELAFNACVDLLDDLRRAGEEQIQRYSDERHENATRLKQLRQAMEEIVQNR